MRIVGGQLRGRSLAAPEHGGLRPTSDRAREAIDEQKVERREFDSKCFRMDPNRMNQAKAELRQFRDRFFDDFLDRRSNHVFQFNFQLFEHTGVDNE